MKILFRAFSVSMFVISVAQIGCMSKRQLIESIPTQTVREIEGEKAHIHPTVPPSPDLTKYKVVAVEQLDNMMLDQIPVPIYDELNKEIVDNISRSKIFSDVRIITDEAELDPPSDGTNVLLLRGSVDDYNAGSRTLRVAELGLNHAVVTIRLQLEDASTKQVLGAATITTYERGFTRTGNSAVHKTAAATAEFISQEITLAKKQHS